jgi:uncharacterized membrane protein
VNILGLPVPDAGPLFAAALVLHVAGGLTCVVTGAVAVLTAKGSPRHRRFGRIYIWGMGVIFATMAVMAVIRWREDAHLFAIGSAAFACGLLGYLNRRRRPRLHIAGMGLSYVLLLTGFYVDNGPHLPLWEHLPPVVHATLPALLGLPLITRALTKAGPHRRA